MKDSDDKRRTGVKAFGTKPARDFKSAGDDGKRKAISQPEDGSHRNKSR